MSLNDPNTVYYDERRRSRNMKDLNAEELFATEAKQIGYYNEKSKKYLDILIDESNLYKPNHETAVSPSCLRMLVAHRKIHAQWPVTALLPRGCYLHESLAVDQKFTQTWKQPILDKLLDPNCMEHLTFELDRFNTTKFNSIMMTFVQARESQKDLYFSSDLQPFMVQTIKISKQSYEDLKTAYANKEKCYTIECPADIEDPVEIPIGLTLSDGATTTLTLRFPWQRVPADHDGISKPPTQSFTFTFSKISIQFKQLLERMDTMYAENAHHQINILKKFLSDFYNLTPTFKVVDLGAIAIAAGCRMDSLDLFSLSVVSLYVIFPPDLDNMDQRFGWDVVDQPKECRDYLEVKFKCLLNIYQVLMGMLIRNLFPDPDIVLYSVRMTQSTFVSWFCDFVAEALSDTRIHPGPDHVPTHFKMKTRADMVQSIKNGPNFLLDQLTDLYINVPVAICGGARYLHSSIHVFFNQFAVIEKIQLPKYLGEQPRPRSDLLDQKYHLMFNREFAIDDSGTPAIGIGLLPNPQYVDTLYNLDITSVTTNFLLKLEPQNNRPIAPAMLEWCRLHAYQMNTFFFKLNKISVPDLAEFWLEKIRIYDYARGLTTRVLSRNLRVRSLDLVLANREDNTVQQMEASVLRNSQNLTETRRLNTLKDKFSSEAEDRNGVQESVYKMIPGNNAENNRIKNAYRNKKMYQYHQDHPSSKSPRDLKKVKRLKVLRSVESVVNPVIEKSPAKSNSRKVTDFAKPNSKGQTVQFNFSSQDNSREFERGFRGYKDNSRRDSTGHSGKDSRGHSNRDSQGTSGRDLRNPTRRHSRSPTRRHSRSPTRRHSRSPTRRHSRSSVKRHSKSPSRKSKSIYSGYQSRNSSRSKSPKGFSGQDLRNKISRRY